MVSTGTGHIHCTTEYPSPTYRHRQHGQYWHWSCTLYHRVSFTNIPTLSTWSVLVLVIYTVPQSILHQHTDTVNMVSTGTGHVHCTTEYPSPTYRHCQHGQYWHWSCTLYHRVSFTNIPTLSTWSVLALAIYTVPQSILHQHTDTANMVSTGTGHIHSTTEYPSPTYRHCQHGQYWHWPYTLYHRVSCHFSNTLTPSAWSVLALAMYTVPQSILSLLQHTDTVNTINTSTGHTHWSTHTVHQCILSCHQHTDPVHTVNTHCTSVYPLLSPTH